MLWAHGERDCERNSDGQGGLSSRPVWENRTFESYEEACDYLADHSGSYWVGGCFAKVYQKNAKAEEVKNRIAEAKQNLAEYVRAPTDAKFIDSMADTMESEMKWLLIPDSVVETLFLWIVNPDSLPYSVEYGMKVLQEVRKRH